MPRRSSKRPTLLDIWVDSAAIGMATMTTLAIRVPQIVTGTMTRAEQRRMVSEKVLAAQRGLQDAALVASRIALSGPRRPTPAGLLDASAAVIDAMSAPARRTVAANAKRLSAPKPQRRKPQ